MSRQADLFRLSGFVAQDDALRDLLELLDNGVDFRQIYPVTTYFDLRIGPAFVVKLAVDDSSIVARPIHYLIPYMSCYLVFFFCFSLSNVKSIFKNVEKKENEPFLPPAVLAMKDVPDPFETLM